MCECVRERERERERAARLELMEGFEMGRDLLTSNIETILRFSPPELIPLYEFEPSFKEVPATSHKGICSKERDSMTATQSGMTSLSLPGLVQ